MDIFVAPYSMLLLYTRKVDNFQKDNSRQNLTSWLYLIFTRLPLLEKMTTSLFVAVYSTVTSSQSDTNTDMSLIDALWKCTVRDAKRFMAP